LPPPTITWICGWRDSTASWARLERSRALLAIEHVRPRHLVLARAHHRELDLVLDVLDMEGAARRMAAHERLDHGLSECLHLVAHARARRGGVARHREECLGHGDRDLVGLEAHDRAIAPDDLVVRVSLLRR